MITNPILPGFHPDASVCAVGGDYYIATSTFEWWPGVRIYHSTDLENWKLVSQPLNRKEQLSMVGDRNSGGIWAPHLSWSDGKFWLMITDMKTDQCFKDTLNYLMTCDRIDGEWSDPVFVNASGFDPAMFHDTDGKKYVMSMLWDYRPYKPNFNGVAVQEYDPERGKLVGQARTVFHGTGWGLTEGPQIIKKDGWYYLLCAEGGTGYSHASVLARSRSVWGEYEISPYTPLISTRFAPDSPLQKCGHASFLKTAMGEWYITYICARPLKLPRGNCVLGRETGLAAIEWTDGWARLKDPGEAAWILPRGGEIRLPDRTVTLPKPPAGTEWNRWTVPPVMVSVDFGSDFGANSGGDSGAHSGAGRKPVLDRDYSTDTDFTEDALPDYFQSLREPLGRHMSLTERPGYLRLYGQQSIASVHSQTMVARRWQSTCFAAGTTMEFRPVSCRQMAGLTCFYNTENYMYAYLSYDEDRNCRILDVLVCDQKRTRVLLGENRISVPDTVNQIHLEVRVERERLRFFYGLDKDEKKPLGEILPADHLSDDYIRESALVFSGSMVGVCAQDLYDHSSCADFDRFYYKENREQ